MNNLKVIRMILGLIIILTQNAFSQDSIFKKDGEMIAAKILEINKSEVRFKKSNNANGPTYTELKSELLYIKFANGTVDTINRAIVIKPITKDTSLVIKYSRKEFFLYPDMGDLEIFSTIESLPPSASKDKLKREYVLMKKYKSQQYLACSLGWVVGFGVPVVVTFGVLSNYNSYGYSVDNAASAIVIGALAGAAIRITGQVLTKINKNKRKQARRNIMLMYNGMN